MAQIGSLAWEHHILRGGQKKKEKKLPRTFRGHGFVSLMGHQPKNALSGRDHHHRERPLGKLWRQPWAPHSTTYGETCSIGFGSWSLLEDPRESETCGLDLGFWATVSMIQS